MPTRKKLLARTVMLATLFALLSAGAYAQKTVSGKVTNKANGQPIPGATIQLRGTSTVTVTNAEGIYSINTKGTGGTLVATVVGFEPVEQPINGRNLISFALTETTASLSEVLVTGYSTQRKKDITGSVAVVNVNNMKSVPSGTTESILQGQASGVSVINSGAPGGGSNIRIRGITSLGNSNPLVIIDGVQGSLHDLNVNDIESVQVLKDAGAAAIYGVQGSNGVVIVTTKKGKSGKAKVTYDAFVGTQRPLKNGFNLANTPEYASVIWAQAKNSGVNPSHPQFGNGASPVIPDYITPSGAKEGDPNTNPAAYDINKNQITRANKVGTDWVHETFKPAMIQSHSISVSGGNDKSAYLFSVGYFNQQGTLINTYLKRYSVRLNTVFNVKDHIRIGENAYIFYKQNPGFTNQNEGNAISFTYREPPIIPIYDIMGNFAGTKSKGLSNSQNPVANQMRTADNKGNDWQVNGNVFAEVGFLQHFTARTSFGGNFDNYYY